MSNGKSKAALLEHHDLRTYETPDGSEPYYSAARRRSERLAKPLTAVGCVVAVACLLSTAANIYFYLRKSDAQAHSPLSCFRCDEIDGYPVDWSKVQPHHDGDPNVCCMQPKDFLSLVEKVSLTAAKQELASVLPSRSNGVSGAASQIRPSIHLGLAVLSRRDGEVRGCNVTNDIKSWSWRANSNGHIRGDLSVKLGRILVNTTGFYHVYSQVSSEDKSGGLIAKLPQRHSIFRDNAELTVVAEELLTAETTRCKDLPGQQSGDAGSSSLTSSYLGAALLLFKGDEVYVRVSCIDDLKEDAAETYFGMYMV